jgi:hypothetical protein
MNEKASIWHLIGSTSTILIFLFVNYAKLVTAEELARNNKIEIEKIKEEVRNIDKVLIILEIIETDIKEVKATNEKFKSDISKFYQLNPNLINPELK